MTKVRYNGFSHLTNKGENEIENKQIKLTKDELERISTTLNYYNVAFYHKKMDQATEFNNYDAYKFYEKKRLNNVDLFCKINKMKKEA